MIGEGPSRRRLVGAFGFLLPVVFVMAGASGAEDRGAASNLAAEYGSSVRPILTKYCLGCHSEDAKKGDLDLERFTTLDAARKDVKPWQGVVEMLESGEMPPKKKPQPTAVERQTLIAWVRDFLDAEARARAGDPGPVGLRRLSHAEYDATIRDVTGVALKPARDFPADGAAGEGFTNASEALGMSPTLLAKYLKASKEIASHAILLPDGVRFSPTNTRRDWTDESVAGLRKFYADYADGDGRLPMAPYLKALVRHRDDLLSGKATPQTVAASEKLHVKYLEILWKAFSSEDHTFPLDRLRSLWRRVPAEDSGALVAEVTAWQVPMWKFQQIGSYRYGAVERQVANEPAVVEAQTLRTGLKPAPGQGDVVLYLVASDFASNGEQGFAVWQRPRFEGGGQPALLLRDYAEFGAKYEVDFASLFADTPAYLSAAIEAANDRRLSAEDLAGKHHLDAAWLKRWLTVAAAQPFGGGGGEAEEPDRSSQAVALTLLDDSTTVKPSVHGWKTKGGDLPSLVANSSEGVEQIPGRISPHQVAVHPTSLEFVAAAWKAPIGGTFRVGARVAHAHAACGNGVAWWLEHRKGDRATVLAEGTLDVGKETTISPRSLKIAPGDLVMLAIDARDGNNGCDLTEISMTLTEVGQEGRKWDLAGDVTDRIALGNPHADGQGNPAVWSFVKGPTRAVSGESPPSILADSILGKWREAASDPGRQAEATKLAQQLKVLLTGARPADEKHPDRKLFDLLASPDGPLLRGADLARLANAPSPPGRYGLDKAKFGDPAKGAAVDEASLSLPINQVVEVRLPAALFLGREFVVDGRLDGGGGERAVQFQVLTAPPTPDARWDGKTPLVVTPGEKAPRQLLAGCAEFRKLFPPFICFPNVIPLDEVVCLKTFHREDEPLIRLFLDEEQTRKINRLWEEHRFISKSPVVENEYLPLFIGFVTQDQPKELLDYFESQRGPFRLRAEEFEKDFEAAAPRQWKSVFAFASAAYRRPLTEGEEQGLLGLYRALRGKGTSHEDAIRGMLERVLVSPSFLYHLEQAPPGKEPGPVNDWELASRLSYFLWSSAPDEELRRAAAEGRLHEPGVLAAQAGRMLKDGRVRSLAIEFGAQWLHVRGFDEAKEKNERLFPTFDAELRKAIYEESILFFLDLFQNDRAVTQVLDADYTYLDETLAKHYGIPGVSGPQWRRVDGVKSHGRGGILGLASVLTSQAGASRTSPVLRGNWVVETLLGEKLPRPPADIPRLPEEETGNDGLTMRQLTEKHVSAEGCAVCHRRIDPFGFALEKYDPIGRFREKDAGGLPVDAKSRLREGTEFEGIDGLRSFLLTQKKDVFVRLFCRRLLGYALGREVILSDQPLIDEMISQLNQHDGRVSSLVRTIIDSSQFREIRGGAYAEPE